MNMASSVGLKGHRNQRKSGLEVTLAPLRNVLKERTNLAMWAGYSMGIQNAGAYPHAFAR